MTTGIVGVVTGTGTIAYTPVLDAKVIVTASGAGAAGIFSVNGLSAIVVGSNLTVTQVIYVAAGQTLTVVSPSTGYLIMSSIEG